MDRPRRSLDDVFTVIAVALLSGGIAFVALLAWQRSAEPGPGERIREPPPDLPWIADHPLISAVFVVLIIAVIGRLYVFMRRLEDRR